MTICLTNGQGYRIVTEAIARVGYHLRDVLKRELSQPAAALEHMQGWYAAGGSSRLDLPGAEVATQINTMFRMMQTDLTTVYGGGDSGLSRFVKTVNRRLSKDAQADVSTLEQDFVDSALAHAWNTSQRTYGGAPETWNAAARRQVLQRKLGYMESWAQGRLHPAPITRKAVQRFARQSRTLLP